MAKCMQGRNEAESQPEYSETNQLGRLYKVHETQPSGLYILMN